jgi:MFS family permease
MNASRSPFAHPAYRRLFAAQVIALLGSGLATVGLALLAYDLAGGGAGAVLGTALALKMVAFVGIAPLFGAVSHRLPRRALLVGLDLARAAVVGCLPFVSQIWQIYLLIFLLNACSAGFTPLFQATIPDLLPDERVYTKALSYSRLAYDLESLLSPTLAAAALLAMSYDALFGFNALAFLVSGCLVVSVLLPRARSVERAGFLANLSFGIAAYLRTPRLRGLLALNLAVAAAGAFVIVNTVVYVRDRLGGSEADTALALAAYGAGSMGMALMLPRLLDELSERRVMLVGSAALVSGLLLAAMLRPGLLGLALIWLFLGAGASAIQTPGGRLLRRSAADRDRPAIYAAQFALSHACWLGTYPLAGWLGTAAGFEATLLVLTALALIGGLIAAHAWPAKDPLVLSHEHPARDHSHPHVHDEHHRHEHEGWEGPEPHAHPHRHGGLRHSHAYVIDLHHPSWPR